MSRQLLIQASQKQGQSLCKSGPDMKLSRSTCGGRDGTIRGGVGQCRVRMLLRRANSMPIGLQDARCRAEIWRGLIRRSFALDSQNHRIHRCSAEMWISSVKGGLGPTYRHNNLQQSPGCGCLCQLVHVDRGQSGDCGKHEIAHAGIQFTYEFNWSVMVMLVHNVCV